MAPFDYSENLNCPLLGLFGNEDKRPSPEDVDSIEAELQRHGKTYEFHRYDGAGHSFFTVNSPAYNQPAANDGWQQIFTWFRKYLSG